MASHFLLYKFKDLPLNCKRAAEIVVMLLDQQLVVI